jgi:hypothetical protein
VTPLELVEKAIEIAAMPNVIFCSFGDMLRVPGDTHDLLTVKARGGDVRIVYSPLDAVALARANPQREVVFFAVGFETTAPANAMAVFQASRLGLSNFSMLVSHVLVPPAMEAILCVAQEPGAGLSGRRACLHRDGIPEYEPLVEKYRVPIVVTGFEPLDILQGVYMCVKQLEEGRAVVENQYATSGASHREPAGAGVGRQDIPRGAAQVAGYRRDSAERPRPRSCLCRLRRRAAFRCRRPHCRRARGMLQRTDHAGPVEAASMPGLRRPLHARASIGRDDGVVRRLVRGVLPVSPAAAAADGSHEREGGGPWRLKSTLA